MKTFLLSGYETKAKRAQAILDNAVEILAQNAVFTLPHKIELSYDESLDEELHDYFSDYFWTVFDEFFCIFTTKDQSFTKHIGYNDLVKEKDFCNTLFCDLIFELPYNEKIEEKDVFEVYLQSYLIDKVKKRAFEIFQENFEVKILKEKA